MINLFHCGKEEKVLKEEMQKQYKQTIKKRSALRSKSITIETSSSTFIFPFSISDNHTTDNLNKTNILNSKTAKPKQNNNKSQLKIMKVL